ncbi:MAG: hypothetical protein VCF25_22275 [Candidatus Poribacteria bacterium]
MLKCGSFCRVSFAIVPETSRGLFLSVAAKAAPTLAASPKNMAVTVTRVELTAT